MMFYVFYTRQAYVRAFMKDHLDHPDLRSHRHQRSADELYLTGQTTPFLRVSSYRATMYRCVSNRPLR